jgi:hypothetical protein
MESMTGAVAGKLFMKRLTAGNIVFGKPLDQNLFNSINRVLVKSNPIKHFNLEYYRVAFRSLSRVEELHMRIENPV